MIRFVVGVPDEAEAIYDLLAECGRHMVTRGFSNWDPPPFSLARVRSDLVSRKVITAREANSIVGTITVGLEAPSYLEEPVRTGSITWHDPGARAIYINRLGVHPDWQQSGLGTRLMDEAERWGRGEGATASRLEAFAPNAALLAWYERRGYRHSGTRSMPDRELRALEKLLTDREATPRR